MKVISGGQTGVDQIGLAAAKQAGIPTGGTACRGFGTEFGPDESLKAYGLVECQKPGYPVRTIKNVRDAHTTVVFTANLKAFSMGSALTIETCKKYGKPCLVNPPDAEAVVAALARQAKDLAPAGQALAQSGLVVNIAGSRGSRLTKSRAAEVAAILGRAFGGLR